MNTSLSDIPLVHQSCEQALAWSRFRSLPGFLYAMENFPESSHQDLLNAVPEKDLTSDLFASDIGEPPKIRSSQGWISPTMLRYSAISRDIGRRFDMGNTGIIEIGCGFGGQCRVLQNHYGPNGMTVLIDTNPMINVAREYLSHFGRAPVHFYPAEWALGLSAVVPRLNLLCISNYALSEMRRDVQEMYFDKIIRRCPRGYVHWNAPKCDFDSMNAEEFFCLVSHMDVAPVGIEKECVPIDPSVQLITWGGK